jgi:hypothetical protein
LIARWYDKKAGARGLKREARDMEKAARGIYNSIPGCVTQDLNNSLLEKLEIKLMPRTKAFSSSNSV